MKYKIICYFNKTLENTLNHGNYSKSILKVFPDAKIFSGPDELILLLDYVKTVLFPIIITHDYLASDIPKWIPIIAINWTNVNSSHDREKNNLIYLHGQKKLFEKRFHKNSWFLISDDSEFDSLSKTFKNVNKYKIVTISNNDEDFNLQMKLLVKSFYVAFYYSSLVSAIEI